MSTFTELKIGRVPITEEGVDRYRISDSILNHFTEISSLEDLNTSVGRIWTEMKVPLPWLQICTANYISGTIEFNNPVASSLEVRGWIDSVEPVSDTEDFPVCRVKWHFDFWEMYKVVASYDYGQVKRRPFSGISSTPIQNYPVRFQKVSPNFKQLVPDTPGLSSKYWWVWISYTKTDNGTWFRNMLFPVDITEIDKRLWFTHNGVSKEFPTLYGLLNGGFDEEIGIAPSAILGAWLTPFCPVVSSASGSGTQQDPFSFSPSASFSSGGISGSNYAALIYMPVDTPSRTFTFQTPLMSTEEERWAVMSTDGSIVMELPYGMTVTECELSLSINPGELSINLAFKGEGMQQLMGNPAGLMQSVVLPTLPINSNSQSEYYYSGQREYDIDTRNIQTNAGAWKNTATGAGQGAMMGAFGPQGLVLGMAGGMLGGLVSYGVESLWENDEIQKSEDRLQSKQISNLLLSGFAWMSYHYRYNLRIVKIIPDDYSLSQLSNTRSNYGISVDEILASCDTLIRTTSPTGFYQIPNLIISGPLPVEAKDTIKQKFSAGVRLI